MDGTREARGGSSANGSRRCHCAGSPTRARLPARWMWEERHKICLAQRVSTETQGRGVAYRWP